MLVKFPNRDAMGIADFAIVEDRPNPLRLETENPPVNPVPHTLAGRLPVFWSSGKVKGGRARIS